MERMRLIDADVYKKEFLESRTFEPFKILDMQPTVQAIPIESIDKIKAEIEFERDRKLGGEAFEAVQYKSYQKCLDIINKYIGEQE